MMAKPPYSLILRGFGNFAGFSRHYAFTGCDRFMKDAVTDILEGRKSIS
jgi:hypothetical protein